MKALLAIFRFTLIAGVVTLVASYFLRDALPDKKDILPVVYNEPLQTPTAVTPFNILENGITYHIAPKYNYEFNALVGSYVDNETWYNGVRNKIDPANVKDVCIFFGKDIKTNVYQSTDVYNQDFVCFIKPKPRVSPAEWAKTIAIDGLSNNHLITKKDSQVYNALKNISVGDQIHLKGYLVEYQVEKDNTLLGQRGTSTVRTDDGNGACETIYVTDFSILKKGNIYDSTLFGGSLYVICFSLLALFILFIVDLISISGRNKTSVDFGELPDEELAKYLDQKLHRENNSANTTAPPTNNLPKS